MMQVNVKRSELVQFHSAFYNSCPITSHNIYLTFSPDNFFLLAKVISSFLSKKIKLNILVDDYSSVDIIHTSEAIDKNLLQNVLDTMDQQALLDDVGFIHFKSANSLSVLILLEAFLAKKDLLTRIQSHEDAIVLNKLFSIRKKLGYSNSFNSNPLLNENSFSLKMGAIVNVADDSGAKAVQIVSEVEPMVYIVNIVKVKFGNEHKFPHGKKYAAVLLRNLLLNCTLANDVCLFSYHNGITQPLFTTVLNRGVTLSKDLLNYEQINDSCSFT